MLLVVTINRIRRITFSIAKKQALDRLNTENKKMYVIRINPIAYRVFSTSDIKRLERKGEFNKKNNYMSYEKASSFYCFRGPGGEILQVDKTFTKFNHNPKRNNPV